MINDIDLYQELQMNIPRICSIEIVYFATFKDVPTHESDKVLSKSVSRCHISRPDLEHKHWFHILN